MLSLRSDARKRSPVKVHAQSLIVPKSKLRQVFTSPSSIVANDFKIRVPSKTSGQDKTKARITRKIVPQNSTISSQGGGDKPKSKIVARNSIEASEYQTKLQLKLFTKPHLKTCGYKKKVVGKIIKKTVLAEDCFPPIPPIAILSTPPTLPVLLPQPASQVQKVPSAKKNYVPLADLEKNRRKIEERFLKKASTHKVTHCRTADLKARPPPATKKTTKNVVNDKKTATKKEPPKLVPLVPNIDENTRKTKQKKDEIKDKYSPRIKEIWRKLDFPKKRSSGRRSGSSSGYCKSRTSRENRERSHENPQKVNKDETVRQIEAQQKVNKDETVKQTKTEIEKDETVDDILTEAHRMIWSWLFSGLTANNRCNPVAQANFVSDETKNNK